MRNSIRKILTVSAAALSLICAVTLTSCEGMSFISQPEATPIPELNPTEILSAAEVAAYVGYEPVLDGGDITRDGNTASALYRTEPIGWADTVEITITQHNDSVSIEDVWNVYAEAKAARGDTEEVTELGENAYIAFPSINIYDRGCYIKITAGSGSDDGQRNLLMQLARVAVANFEAIWAAPVIE